MIVQNLYVADDEVFGTSESMQELTENYFDSDKFYENIFLDFDDEYNIELSF